LKNVIPQKTLRTLYGTFSLVQHTFHIKIICANEALIHQYKDPKTKLGNCSANTYFRQECLCSAVRVIDNIDIFYWNSELALRQYPSWAACIRHPFPKINIFFSINLSSKTLYSIWSPPLVVFEAKFYIHSSSPLRMTQAVHISRLGKAATNHKIRVKTSNEISLFSYVTQLDWYLVTDFSAKYTCPIFNCQTFQDP